MDYVTLSEVKDILIDFASDTTYDTFLNKLITRSSRAIDRWTGRSFDQQLATLKKFDGNNTSKLFLREDLITVSLLRVKVGGTQGTLTTVPSTDYFLEPHQRRPGHPAQWIELTNWPSSTSNVVVFDYGKLTVEVTGDWGWAAIPDEIKEVCLETVVRLFRMRGAGQSEQSSADNLSPVIVPRALSGAGRDIIEAYTRHVFA